MFLSLRREGICRQQGETLPRQQGTLPSNCIQSGHRSSSPQCPFFACALFEHHAARNGQGVWEWQSQRIAILDVDEHRIRFLTVLVLIEL